MILENFFPDAGLINFGVLQESVLGLLLFLIYKSLTRGNKQNWVIPLC